MNQVGRIISGVIMAGALAGCASEADYMRSLSVYQGLTERELIERKGVPTNSYEVDGYKYLSYITTRSYDTTPTASVYGGTGGWGGGPVFGTGASTALGNSSYRVSQCENTFVIFRGVVQKVGYKGNCY